MNETPATFKADCPHCGTKSVAFTILNQQEIPKAHYYFSVQWDTFAVCGFCKRGIVASFLKPQTNDSSPSVLLKQGEEISPSYIAPPVPETKAPLHTPEKVGNYYEQGMDNLQGENWDAAGAMFRTALEATFNLKEKFPDSTGTLYDRIASAGEKRQLTPDMAEWAQQIRRLGNHAVHAEEPFSEEEAKELQAFTDLFFRYIFMLPGMLEEARKKGETRGNRQKSIPQKPVPNIHW